MKKRLLASFLIVGAISATMIMGASAFWTTDNVNVQVNATAGTADLKVEGFCNTADGECNATISIDEKVYPGWSEESQGKFKNTGDVTLNVIFKNRSFSGGLRNALLMELTCGETHISARPITHESFQNGVKIATLEPGEEVVCTGKLSLPHTGENQNNLQGQTASWTSTIFGRTN